jgi:hypothetical protein
MTENRNSTWQLAIQSFSPSISCFMKVNNHLAIAVVPVGAEDEMNGAALAQAPAISIDLGDFAPA